MGELSKGAEKLVGFVIVQEEKMTNSFFHNVTELA